MSGIATVDQVFPYHREGVDQIVLCVQQLRRRVSGGIGTYARGLITGLLAIRASERPEIALLASGVRERPDPLRCFGLPVMTSRLPAALQTRIWDANFGRVARGASLVHSVALGGPLSEVPVVVTVHDLAWRMLPETFPARGRRWHEAALRRAARHAAHFVVPSEAVADALVEAGLQIAKDRVSVIEEGADHLPAPDAVGTEYLLNHLGVFGEYFLFVGSHEPRKNLARLIEAYSAIRASLPEPWPLLVVGPHGWGKPTDLDQPGVIVVDSGISNAVLSGLYAQARCVAYVPLLEGFGLPVVEAMSFGAPVVSSDVPAAKGATHLVDPYDVDSIAEGLLTVATHEGRRAELRSLAKMRTDGLSWSATARAHVNLWHAVAAAQR